MKKALALDGSSSDQEVERKGQETKVSFSLKAEEKKVPKHNVFLEQQKTVYRDKDGKVIDPKTTQNEL